MNFRSIKVGDVVEVRANPYDAKTHRKAVVLRVDEHDYCDRIDELLLSSIQNNKCYISMSGEVEVDAIIISDYCKGF